MGVATERREGRCSGRRDGTSSQSEVRESPDGQRKAVLRNELYDEQVLRPKIFTGKHIWSSVHHPQTLGKLSNFQKGMKAFLRHRLGRDRDPDAIDECIQIYVDWYNNGKTVSTTKSYPEERYCGRRDLHWYERLVTSLKLDKILPLPCASGGATHPP